MHGGYRANCEGFAHYILNLTVCTCHVHPTLTAAPVFFPHGFGDTILLSHEKVHQRDVFMDLARLYKERKISSSSDFEWLKQVSRCANGEVLRKSGTGELSRYL